METIIQIMKNMIFQRWKQECIPPIRKGNLTGYEVSKISGCATLESI